MREVLDGKKVFTLEKLKLGETAQLFHDLSQDFGNLSPCERKALLKTDRERLSRATCTLVNCTTLETLFAKIPEINLGEIGDLLEFDHIALFIPSPLEIVASWLAQTGQYQDEAIIFPSTIVAKRLEQRYFPDSQKIEIPTTILLATLTGVESSRSLELFIPTPKPGVLTKKVITQEVDRGHESHLAFRLQKPSEANLKAIINTLEKSLDFETGGINRHQNITLIYYRNPETGARIEIICDGTFDIFSENQLFPASDR